MFGVCAEELAAARASVQIVWSFTVRACMGASCVEGSAKLFQRSSRAIGAAEGEVHWDNLAHALPAVILEHSLGEVTLPARMRNFVTREGLETVGALVGIPRAKLVSEPNLGRTTVLKHSGA